MPTTTPIAAAPARAIQVNETCDRCGPAVRAVYRMDRQGKLYLCGHCASRHWRALCAQGWTMRPLGDYALARPAA